MNKYVHYLVLASIVAGFKTNCISNFFSWGPEKQKEKPTANKEKSSTRIHCVTLRKIATFLSPNKEIEELKTKANEQHDTIEKLTFILFKHCERKNAVTKETQELISLIQRGSKEHKKYIELYEKHRTTVLKILKEEPNSNARKKEIALLKDSFKGTEAELITSLYDRFNALSKKYDRICEVLCQEVGMYYKNINSFVIKYFKAAETIRALEEENKRLKKMLAKIAVSETSSAVSSTSETSGDEFLLL